MRKRCSDPKLEIRWWACASSLAIASASCALDRTPSFDGDLRRDAPHAYVVPARPQQVTVPHDQQFGNDPTPTTPTTTMNQPTVGGLQCSGVFCPFASAPMKPCCTTDADVTQGSAREADRCGLDFEQTASKFFTTSKCWQSDQTGVVDDRCPTFATDPGIDEPGCCTDQGLCGGMNTGQALGCHYAGGVEPKECSKKDIAMDVECDVPGVYGIRSTVDVSWGGRSGGLVGLTDDGRDAIVIHLLTKIEKVDDGTNELHGTVQPCGVELPPFYSTTLCESYKPIFPTEIWESPDLPVVPLAGRMQCRNPGCILTLDAQTVLLGIDLTNPEAPWPTPAETPTLKCMNGKAADCFLDHDDDMLPGLTIKLLTMGMAPPGTGCTAEGYAYKAAPLSSSPAAIFGGVRRADRVLLGTRTKLGGSGTISADCKSGVGSGIAQFVQSRAWGCFLEPGSFNLDDYMNVAGPNDPCDGTEAQFLDENLPIYNILNVGMGPDPALNVVNKKVSDGPLMSMVRLGGPGAAVSCADVRAADYP